MKKITKKIVKKAKTKAERRIIILKDAITQIKLQNIRANPGEVIDLPWSLMSSEFDGKDAKPILANFFKNNNKKEYCSACARGSLLLCTVHKENEFILDDFHACGGSYYKGSTTDTRLAKLFSEQQIALMEAAFEVGDYVNLDDEDYIDYSYAMNEEFLGIKLVTKAVDFGRKYEDPNKRLLAIFANAARNNGIFKP